MLTYCASTCGLQLFPHARWQICFAISPAGSGATAINLSQLSLLISKVSLEELLWQENAYLKSEVFWKRSFAVSGDYGTELHVPGLISVKLLPRVIAYGEKK